MLVSERRAVASSLCGADLLKSPRARSKSNGGSDAMFLRTRPGARQRNLPSDAFHSLSLEHVRGNTHNNRFRRQVVIQFGGAMVLKDRLARTLAPPKCKLYRRPSAGSVLIWGITYNVSNSPNLLQVGAPLPRRTAVPQHRRHQTRTLPAAAILDKAVTVA